MNVDMSRDNLDIKHCYYIIEEFQGDPYNRWVPINDKFYLKEHELGELSVLGKCYQETGEHGIYDLSYAISYCKDLNEALRSGRIKDNYRDVTKFRVSQVEESFKKKVVFTN